MKLLLSSIVMEVIGEFQFFFMKKSHIQKKHKKQKKLHKQTKKDSIFLCAQKTSKKENA